MCLAINLVLFDESCDLFNNGNYKHAYRDPQYVSYVIFNVLFSICLICCVMFSMFYNVRGYRTKKYQIRSTIIQ